MVHCMNCGVSFEQKHASRKYCSNTCNVKASHARNGRPGQLRATRADLEAALAKMMALMKVTPELATATPPTAAKAQAKKPAAKAAVKPARENGKFVKSATKPAAPAAKAAATTKHKKKITTPTPTAKAAATKPEKKITKPAPRKLATKAVVKDSGFKIDTTGLTAREKEDAKYM
jgi:hypothetical protein